MPDQTHDPNLLSWVESANLPNAKFPIQNLPFATFEHGVCTAIGDYAFDLTSALGVHSMLELMNMPRSDRREIRRQVSALLSRTANPRHDLLIALHELALQLPCSIPDYSDFYASIHHARNVGSMFRPDNPLLPNYEWIPIGYHGRASSIVPSGARIRRPDGQIRNAPRPIFGPTRQLDYELEVGAFLGPGNPMGEPIRIQDAYEHLFGLTLLNDLSARDIQAWESQPLGPFLSKSFATTISPWVITQEALEPFRTEAPDRPEPLPYLCSSTADAFRIDLEVWLRTPTMLEPVRISQSDFSSMYWTLAQMITHHASNGCPLRPGDLIGSGTVSGPEKVNRGCLLELTWRGEDPLRLPNDETRTFLENGDEVVFKAQCHAPGFRSIGFGSCSSVIDAGRFVT